MGASGWDYRTPHSTDLAEALRTLRQKVLAEGNYVWDDAEPRPENLESFDELLEDEEFWEEGTHSILDISRVSVDPESEASTLRLLSPEETSDLFGADQPTVADVEGKDLFTIYIEPWTGVAATVYADGEPSEYLIWGISGD
ncbi:hypothetical protein [Streptomyces sp. SID13031]|uniref:hypothetical protein n=1 Tax=Streptomyces sp. SID13031 TaxID=2706046 RepID=UPI0013CAA978|nr:hypothetical protein [Streptomyces sp. SID13031]NEA31227.1 hypothetical protein [Streptomyces sp. SID13031]